MKCTYYNYAHADLSHDSLEYTTTLVRAMARQNNSFTEAQQQLLQT